MYFTLYFFNFELYVIQLLVAKAIFFNVSAVKVAGKMQKEVTEKRSEIDSLHSKIHWLEECMEAAAKVGREDIFVPPRIRCTRK